MIILEGPDRVGKTTLAHKLTEAIKGTYVHFSRLPDSFHRYFDYLPYIKPLNVLDRFHMSEPVYASARGDKELKTNQVWYSAIDRAILANGGVTVLITVDLDLLDSRWTDEEMYDLKTTKMAAVEFRDISQGLSSFGIHPHFDLHFHCTKDKPFLTDEDAQIIVFAHQLSCNRAAYLKATNEFPHLFKANHPRNIRAVTNFALDL